MQCYLHFRWQKVISAPTFSFAKTWFKWLFGCYRLTPSDPRQNLILDGVAIDKKRITSEECAAFFIVLILCDAPAINDSNLLNFLAR